MFFYTMSVFIFQHATSKENIRLFYKLLAYRASVCETIQGIRG